MPCREPGCESESRRSGLCWKHIKRRQRRQRGRTPDVERGMSPKERVLEPVLAYLELNASEPEAWVRAWDRLRMAMRRYVMQDKQPNGSGVHAGRLSTNR